jgi:hypothetical protein
MMTDDKDQKIIPGADDDDDDPGDAEGNTDGVGDPAAGSTEPDVDEDDTGDGEGDAGTGEGDDDDEDDPGDAGDSDNTGDEPNGDKPLEKNMAEQAVEMVDISDTNLGNLFAELVKSGLEPILEEMSSLRQEVTSMREEITASSELTKSALEFVDQTARTAPAPNGRKPAAGTTPLNKSAEEATFGGEGTAEDEINDRLSEVIEKGMAQQEALLEKNVDIYAIAAARQRGRTFTAGQVEQLEKAVDEL